jgi:leishmanolysin-like peptidase
MDKMGRPHHKLTSVGRQQSIFILAATLAALNFIILHPKQDKMIFAHMHHGDFRCSHVPPTPEQVNHVWLDDAQFSSSSTIKPTEVSSEDDSGQPSGRSFTIDNEPEGTDNGPEGTFSRASSSVGAARSRRYIESRTNKKAVQESQSGSNPATATAEPPTSFQDSLWNLFRKIEGLPPLAPQTPASSMAGRQTQQRPGTFPPASQDGSPDDLVPMKIQVYYDSSVYQLDKKKLKSINETVMPSVVKFFEEVLLIRREYTIDRFRISRRCPNNTIYYARDFGGLSRPYCMDHCEDHAVCGEMIVPKEHLAACSYCNTTSRRCTTNYSSEGKGAVNTQLLLYVSARQTVRCKRDQTIAYAAHCAQDTKTDRPVAGHANLCPNSISTDPKDLKALIATVKHELTHVLGFSVSLFAYYRDSNGQPLTERESTPGSIPVDPKTGYAKWSDRVIRRVVRTNWTTGGGNINKEVHMIVTPTVVQEVRRHFNCSTLEGAELEDQGSDGTSMTHWEKRLFENEAMTGTHTQNSVYSRITLAVLQDTGWYVANFSSAERLDWGRNLGCDFAKKSCRAWINERRAKRMSIRPFCDRVKGDLLQIACTEDLNSKAVCNMRHYKEPLPDIYQNFDYLEGTNEQDLAHYGGSVDLADYCPFIQEFTWQVQNVTVRGSRCDLGGNSIESEKNAALEHYGPDSRCFEHGRRWEQRSCIYKRHWHHFGAGCYRFTCSGGHVNVIVGNQSYPCYYADQTIHIEQLVDQWLYSGSLICPACDKICAPSRCANYDRRLIDQIMDLSRQAPMTNMNNTLEMLRSILDEYYNGVDTRSEKNFKKSFTKYRSVLDEMNKSIGNQEQDESYNLLAFPTRDRLQTSHSLICSSASISNQELPLAINLISLITLLLFAMSYTK